MTEDKLRDEAQRLMEEKEEYQEVAKDTLKKLVDEKLEAVKKMQDLEKQLSTTEDEFAVLKELYEKNAEESKELASEVSKLREELENVRQKIPPEPEPESKTMEGTTEKAASAFSRRNGQCGEARGFLAYAFYVISKFHYAHRKQRTSIS